LITASEVDEDVADALAQQLRLLPGDIRRHLLQIVERSRELPDLVRRDQARSDRAARGHHAHNHIDDEELF